MGSIPVGTTKRGAYASFFYFCTMAYYSYVVYNLEHHRFHYGVCKDVTKIERAHNQGLIKDTKGTSPWALVYHEEFLNEELAIRQIRFYRTVAGQRHLKRKLNF